jgi:hypothetical protein
MCQRVTCTNCGKPTFAGCGRHVEQVLGDIPPAQRCRCRESPETHRATEHTSQRGLFKSIKNWLR